MELFGDCWHNEEIEHRPSSDSDSDPDPSDSDVSEVEENYPEEDRGLISLPIMSLPKSKCCVICPVSNSLINIPASVRTHILIEHNVIVPAGAKCCSSHIIGGSLKEDFTISECMLRKAKPSELSPFMVTSIIQSLRAVCKSSRGAIDFNKSMSDTDCYNLTGLHRNQFDDLVSTCTSLRSSRVRSCRQAMGIFLTKMRTGLSNTILSTLFQLASRKTVSRIIHSVRLALLKDFVPEHLGFDHISREEITDHHTTTLAREILAGGDHNIAILVMDGTYIYIQKSGKYTFQRISYSMHKGRPLVKPMVITATDGYILAVLGPYLAKNNDANITKHLFENNVEGIQDWLTDEDVLVLDRGFRDCLDYLQHLGYTCESPPFLGKESQHSVEEGNTSRLITKIRWVVESVNGRLKRWEFLGKTLPNHHIPYIGDYVRIIAAICNKYRPPLKTDDADDEEIAKKMLERAKLKRNPLKALVERMGIKPLVSKWQKVDGSDGNVDFPELSEQYLRSITLGIYQVKQAKAYTEEHLSGDGMYDMFISKARSDLHCIKIQSRHRTAKKYLVWIKTSKNTRDPVDSWYCQCPVGARMVGCCAHVASVLWYLGIGRHYIDPTTVRSLIPANLVDSSI